MCWLPNSQILRAMPIADSASPQSRDDCGLMSVEAAASLSPAGAGVGAVVARGSVSFRGALSLFQNSSVGIACEGFDRRRLDFPLLGNSTSACAHTYRPSAIAHRELSFRAGVAIGRQSTFARTHNEQGRNGSHYITLNLSIPLQVPVSDKYLPATYDADTSRTRC